MAALLRYAAMALGLMVWTWLWFFPVGGFHHMFRCGVLGWAILDGENGATEVRWSLPILLLSVSCYLVPLGLAARAFVRRRRINAQ